MVGVVEVVDSLGCRGECGSGVVVVLGRSRSSSSKASGRRSPGSPVPTTTTSDTQCTQNQPQARLDQVLDSGPPSTEKSYGKASLYPGFGLLGLSGPRAGRSRGRMWSGARWPRGFSPGGSVSRSPSHSRRPNLTSTSAARVRFRAMRSWASRGTRRPGPRGGGGLPPTGLASVGDRLLIGGRRVEKPEGIRYARTNRGSSRRGRRNRCCTGIGPVERPEPLLRIRVVEQGDAGSL